MFSLARLLLPCRCLSTVTLER